MLGGGGECRKEGHEFKVILCNRMKLRAVAWDT